MRTLVIGLGEVGLAHYNLLRRVYSEVDGFDIKGDWKPLSKDEPYDLVLVAMNYAAMGHDKFVQATRDYMVVTSPKVVNVLATVRPGTCEELGPNVNHSTTRGLHPNLETGLLSIPKHVGGPDADFLCRYYRKAGINCVPHRLARTVELAHILNNCAYGVSLMFADEMQRLCRLYGVDYSQAVMLYTQTNNEGFRALDHESKCRMVLTPPNGRIGGHCVTQGAGLIPEKDRGVFLDLLANYNRPKNVKCEHGYPADYFIRGYDCHKCFPPPIDGFVDDEPQGKEQI